MDSEIGRSLSTLRTMLWAALTEQSGGRTMPQAIRELAAPDPRSFFDAALAIVDALAGSRSLLRAAVRLFDCPEFLLELLREGRYSNEELRERCADWLRIDRFLDVRLARLAAGHDENPYHLAPETVARILELLNHISLGPRLIQMLNHLKYHPHPLVAERATVLVGRRIHSLTWVRQRLESTDPRIRAAAVEGLWGHGLAKSRQLFWQYQTDENNRVAGNALMGLHFLGEPKVPGLVKDMIQDARPSFRATAAWVMGQIGETEFTQLLQAAMADPEVAVQVAAQDALVTIRLGVPAEQRFAVRKLTVSTPKRPEKDEPQPPPPPEKPQERPMRFWFDGALNVSDETMRSRVERQIPLENDRQR